MKARGAVIATVLGVLILSALYPLRQYASQDEHVGSMVAQVRSMDRKIADLRREQKALSSDDEVERIAREELGMVRPGEVAFAVVGSQAPESSAHVAPKVAPAPKSGDPWYTRWWDAVSRAAHGMR